MNKNIDIFQKLIEQKLKSIKYDKNILPIENISIRILNQSEQIQSDGKIYGKKKAYHLQDSKYLMAK